MVRFVNHINDFFLKNCAISRFLSFSINDAKLKKKRYNLQQLSKTDQTTEKVGRLGLYFLRLTNSAAHQQPKAHQQP